MGLLPLARAPVELAEAAVAVGDERAHPLLAVSDPFLELSRSAKTQSKMKRAITAGNPAWRNRSRLRSPSSNSRTFRRRSSARDLNVALGELQGRGGEQDRAGRRHLLHASGQVGRLADRRVVHVQI